MEPVIWATASVERDNPPLVQDGSHGGAHQEYAQTGIRTFRLRVHLDQAAIGDPKDRDPCHTGIDCALTEEFPLLGRQTTQIRPDDAHIRFAAADLRDLGNGKIGLDGETESLIKSCFPPKT